MGLCFICFGKMKMPRFMHYKLGTESYELELFAPNIGRVNFNRAPIALVEMTFTGCCVSGPIIDIRC